MGSASDHERQLIAGSEGLKQSLTESASISANSDVLRLVLDSVEWCIVVLDPLTGKVGYANQGASQLLDRPISDLLGRTWSSLIHHEDDDPYVKSSSASLSRVMARQTFRVRVLRGDGDLITVSGEAVRVLTVEGEPLLVVQLNELSREGATAALIRLVTSRPDGDTMARAIALGSIEGVGLDSVYIYRISHRSKCFSLVGSFGSVGEQTDFYDTIAFDTNLPMNDVHRTTTEYRSTVAELVRDYPLSSSWANARPEPLNGGVVLLPILIKAILYGVLVICTPDPLGQTRLLRNELDTITACVACWFGVVAPDEKRSAGAQKNPNQISERQRAILLLAEGGSSNREIAVTLGYSEGTIRSDLLRLSKLFGVRGRESLVELARRSGLLSENPVDLGDSSENFQG